MSGSVFDRILAALSSYEAARANAAIEPARFAQRKVLLANARYLRRSIVLPAATGRLGIPGLRRGQTVGLLAGYMTGSTTVRALASRADAIQLKKNGTRLRAFYLPRGGCSQCVKIVDRQSPQASRLGDEIAVRRRLDRLATITVPAIKRIDEDSRYIYIVEDMVLGRRFDIRRDCARFLEQGLDELARTYRAHGVRHEPLSRHLPANLPAAVAANIHGRKFANAFMDRLRAALERNRPAAVSVCHGDLLPSNLAVSQGRIVFFDWEQAGEGLVSFDLLRLALKYPRARRLPPAIAACVKALSSDLDVCFEDQFTAYLATKIAGNQKRAVERLAYWARKPC